MKKSDVNTYSNLSWYPFSEDPLLEPKWYKPRLCDPAFLLPENSPDNNWHIFAHNWIGIQHFVSDNGLDWTEKKMIELRGHSPFIFHSKGVWYLIYEKHDSSPSSLSFKEFRENRTVKVTSSRIEICSTTDMEFFSKPTVLLESSDIPFAKTELKMPRLSRPQMFYDEENGYRLYFGASHVEMCDTKQKATLYFAMAHSDNLLGPYKIENDAPLFGPDADNEYANLAVGGIRVIPVKDGYVGFECAFGWDPDNNRSISNLIQIESRDGISWTQSKRKPLISLPEDGWASRYITSCDVQYMEDDYCYYCYFSGNAKKRIWKFPIYYIKESLGLLLGKDPTPRKVFE